MQNDTYSSYISVPLWHFHSMINLYLHHNAKYFDIECNSHTVLTLRGNMMLHAVLHMYILRLE